MIVRELITRLGFSADEQKVQAFDNRVKKLNQTLNKTITWATGVGVAAAGMITKSFIQNTMDAEAEQAQLAAVLRSTGEAAGFAIGELNAMSDAIRKNSALDGGDLTNAQVALLAFTNIAGDQFVKANQAAADMASRTGMSVVSAAELIGRALDVPSQGMAALSKQGFRFTEQEKKLIKQLEATGRTAEAQGIIIKALEATYGGAADAASKTFGGTLERLKQTIKDLLTGDAGSLSSLREGLEKLIKKLEEPRVKKAIDDIAGAVIGMILVMGDMIGKAVDLANALGGVEVVAKTVGAVLLAILGLKLAAWFTAATIAAWGFAAALLANPLTWIAAAAIAFGVALGWVARKIYDWIDGNKALKITITDTFNAIKNVVSYTINGIGLIFSDAIDGMIDKWTRFKGFISNPIKGAMDFFSSDQGLVANAGVVANQAASGRGGSPINMSVKNDVKITVPTGTSAEQAQAINFQVDRQMRAALAREISGASLALEGM